jgi:hypothetical protein
MIDVYWYNGHCGPFTSLDEARAYILRLTARDDSPEQVGYIGVTTKESGLLIVEAIRKQASGARARRCFATGISLADARRLY